LLIVTNDGALALHLTHPRHEVTKTYHVRLNAPLPGTAVSRMLAGVESEGERLRAESISPLPKEPHGYQIVLKEGRKRQIRRMVQAVGFTVINLRRVAVGSLKLGILPSGKARALSESEIAILFEESGVRG
jgi:pseudouridine synthase